MDPARARLAISVLDLTDLGDDASDAGSDALCDRAAAAGTAAVCVWPRFATPCARRLAGTGVRVATVANFPGGDEPAGAVVESVHAALAAGADEIDVVLPYRAWLAGDDDVATDLLDAVRRSVSAAGEDRKWKVIIESGALPDAAAVRRATEVAIAAGADFVKTSTGKTAVSATPQAAETILRTIAASGRPVGFKASGGIRTAADADRYLDLADRVMGPGWVSPATFRFGASALLDALVA